LDVQLVDDGVLPGTPRRRVSRPVELRVDHHAARDERRTIQAGHGAERVAADVTKHRRVPAQAPLHRPRVGIEQQLVGVAAMPGHGLVGPVHAIAVALPRPDPLEVAMPVRTLAMRQLQTALGAVGVEQAQLDALACLGEEAEVGAATVEMSSQRPSPTRSQLTHGPRYLPIHWPPIEPTFVTKTQTRLRVTKLAQAMRL